MSVYHWVGLIALGWGCLFGGLGAYVASQKGRSEGEGMAFGFLLGPIGCLIVAILPDVKAKPAEDAPVIAYQFRPRRMLGEVTESRSLRRVD